MLWQAKMKSIMGGVGPWRAKIMDCRQKWIAGEVGGSTTHESPGEIIDGTLLEVGGG